MRSFHCFQLVRCSWRRMCIEFSFWSRNFWILSEFMTNVAPHATLWVVLQPLTVPLHRFPFLLALVGCKFVFFPSSLVFSSVGTLPLGKLQLVALHHHLTKNAVKERKGLQKTSTPCRPTFSATVEKVSKEAGQETYEVNVPADPQRSIKKLPIHK